jgi:hypothetical protein
MSRREHVSKNPSPRGLLTALAMSLTLVLLVAGGVADRGGTFPLVLLGGSAIAVGALTMLFPHGPQFALGATNGLAMYACLFVVLGRAGFPEAPGGAREAAFLLPITAFVLACWLRRRELGAWAQGEEPPDLKHLPRFARWLGAIGVVGIMSLMLPMNRLPPPGQGAALLTAMGIIAAISALAVGDVVRLLVDIAAIFRNISARLSRLAVPIAAFASLWALLVVVFGCIYRIADGVSQEPLFKGGSGAVRLGFSDALHFSVVTLSSVGYGDIIPVDDGIRLLAAMQMLCSQLLLLFGFYEIMRGSPVGWSDGNGDEPKAGEHKPHDRKPHHRDHDHATAAQDVSAPLQTTAVRRPAAAED